MDGKFRNLRKRLNAERFDFFFEVISSLPRPVRILDLGGTAAFWRSFANGNTEETFRVTLVNNHHIDPTQRTADISCSWIKEKRIDALDSNQWDMADLFPGGTLKQEKTLGLCRSILVYRT